MSEPKEAAQRQKRMPASIWRHYRVHIAAAVVSVALLAGQLLFMVFLVGVPTANVYALIVADLLLLAPAVILLALLLVSNTRRPHGVHPDDVAERQRQPLPIYPLAEERAPPPRRRVAYDSQGRPYGRRAGDVDPDHIGVVLAALRDLPKEARASMLGLGVVTDPAELRRAVEDEDAGGAGDEHWEGRPDWAERVMQQRPKAEGAGEPLEPFSMPDEGPPPVPIIRRTT